MYSLNLTKGNIRKTQNEKVSIKMNGGDVFLKKQVHMTVYSMNGIGRIREIHAGKNTTRPPSYSTHKNKLKMD